MTARVTASEVVDFDSRALHQRCVLFDRRIGRRVHHASLVYAQAGIEFVSAPHDRTPRKRCNRRSSHGSKSKRQLRDVFSCDVSDQLGNHVRLAVAHVGLDCVSELVVCVMGSHPSSDSRRAGSAMGALADSVV